MKFNKLMMVASATAIIFPLVNPNQVTAGIVVNRLYKVTASFTIDNSEDGPLDDTLEVYGEVRIDNNIIRSIPRNAAQSRKAGQTLSMGEVVVSNNTNNVNTSRNITVNAFLNDRDTLPSDDKVFQSPTIQLNLADVARAGTNGVGERTFPFKSTTGEASTLHIRIEALPLQ
jgi:hypothetical protein